MLPLSDIRVLDFSRFMPGPYCTLLLADFGADVVRIEQPREVAKHKRLFGYDKMSENERKRIKAFEQVQRNKRSVLLDFRQPTGLAALRKMVSQSDVLVHDYRPGVMEKAGLAYSDIQSINPRIIYLAVSLCGQSGPYRNIPGHDPISLSLAGVLPQLGVTRDQPGMADAPVSDVIAALHGAVGVMMALRSRDKTGKGQMIDLAMSDTALSLMLLMYSRYLPVGKLPEKPRWGGNNGVWRTKDGKWLCTTDVEPAYWNRWCDAVGRPDLKPKYRNRLENTEEFKKIFAGKTRDEWIALFRDADTQGAPVLTWEEVLSDPHQRARGNIMEIDHPELGPMIHIGPLIKLSATPAKFRDFAHSAGKDTQLVLEEFGFNADEIETLITQAESTMQSEENNI